MSALQPAALLSLPAQSPAVSAAILRGALDARRWMAETPRAWWPECLLEGAVSCDAALQAELGCQPGEVVAVSEAYCAGFVGMVRAGMESEDEQDEDDSDYGPVPKLEEPYASWMDVVGAVLRAGGVQ